MEHECVLVELVVEVLLEPCSVLLGGLLCGELLLACSLLVALLDLSHYALLVLGQVFSLERVLLDLLGEHLVLELLLDGGEGGLLHHELIDDSVPVILVALNELVLS